MARGKSKMLISGIGLLTMIIGYLIKDMHLTVVGFGAMFFDITSEIWSLKIQLFNVGVALRDAIRKIK